MNLTIYTKSGAEIIIKNISDGAVKIFEDWFGDDLKWPAIAMITENDTKIGVNRNEISYYKIWAY